jgi:hypothetical protein
MVATVEEALALRSATAAVVKARKVSITATAPFAFLAPSKRLWIEIFIAAAVSGFI